MSENDNFWRMTSYDMQRQPLPLLPDSTIVEADTSSLKLEMTCPICLDLLRDTVVTKECLHRFCDACISTALRSGKKECPACRRKLISKRSLRRDLTIDRLIECLYPCRQQYEQFQDDVTKSMFKHATSAVSAKHRVHAAPDNQSGPECSSSSISKLGSTQLAAATVTSTNALIGVQGPAAGQEHVGDQCGDLCNIKIVCNPCTSQDGPVRLLRAQSNVTVHHLIKYLYVRSCRQPESLEIQQPSGALKVVGDEELDDVEFYSIYSRRMKTLSLGQQGFDQPDMTQGRTGSSLDGSVIVAKLSMDCKLVQLATDVSTDTVRNDPGNTEAGDSRLLLSGRDLSMPLLQVAVYYKKNADAWRGHGDHKA